MGRRKNKHEAEETRQIFRKLFANVKRGFPPSTFPYIYIAYEDSTFRMIFFPVAHSRACLCTCVCVYVFIYGVHLNRIFHDDIPGYK